MRLLILILIWQTKDWVKNNTMIKLTDLLEAEKAFTATSKETGNVSVFKTKAARDAAVKAGSHEKRKDDKEDAVDVPTGEKKPNMFSKDAGYDAPDAKSDTPKDSTGDRAGNAEVNKVVRNTAKKLGITPAKLGKDEYKLKMSQAAVEALTDANFHSEARALIAKLEGKPEWAEKPTDMPDISSPEYDEWRKNSVYSSKYYDADDSVMDLGTTASQEAGWDGRDALDSIAFDLKMNGFKNLAATLQSVIDDEKNEGTIKLTDLLKEGKFKKEERDLKNLAGTLKIDFEEALEMLEEDGVLEAMEHLENAIERIQYVHKQLKRKS